MAKIEINDFEKILKKYLIPALILLPIYAVIVKCFELSPRVGFIVIKLSCPAERVEAFYN